MIARLPIIVFLLLLLVKVCYAQNGKLSFHRVAPPKGASASGASAVIQDKQGFMWVGQHGLHRYDGYHYTSYYNDPLKPTSLGGNRVEYLCIDRYGFIWVGTIGNGLDRLDPATGIFTHFRHDANDKTSLSNDGVTAILEDSEGTIWVGTHEGLNRLNPKTKKFARYLHDPKDPKSLSNNQIRTVYQDRQGTIWVGCGEPFVNDNGKFSKDGGLNRFDRKTEQFIRYLHNPQNPQSLIDNRVQDIFEDSRGIFWIGTAGDGLHTMDRAKGTFERHTYDAVQPEKLSRPSLKKVIWYAQDHITFITEDTTGAIWIGTFGNGINRYDPVAKKVTHFPNFKDPASGKEIENAWSAYTSREGVLWIAYLEGLYRIEPLHKNIPFFEIGAPVGGIYQDETGVLWYSGSPGLVRKGLSNGTEKLFVHEPQNPSSISNNNINAIYKDRQGVLWIGTGRGLNRFDEKGGSFTSYLANPNKDSSLIDDNVLCIYEDGKGLFWIGTSGGLNLMNRQTGTVTRYLHNSNDTNSISRNHINCISEDRSGNLWIGTYLGGLNRFSPQTGKFQRFLYKAEVHSIVQDSEGVLWVGTESGLYRSNQALNNFSLFTDPNNSIGGNIVVGGILEDDQKALWAHTSLGIYRINPQRKESVIYSSGEDQHYDNEKAYKGRKGELFFGTKSGYYAFFPHQMTINLSAPHVVLSGFRIANQPVLPGGESPLKEALWQTKEIHLDHNQNVFSFEFAGIHYSNPEQNRHLFMLEGLDTDWRKAGEEKTAYYYNVPPGDYTFRVKAANSDGVWAEKSIAVIIYPPWWRTWWAYIFYGLLFLAGVYVVYRYQRKRFIEKERERQRRLELEHAKEIEQAYTELKSTQAQLIQSEKMASLGELTAGIAHEIQNPLNFVNNFSETNAELIDELEQATGKGDLAEAREIAKTIRENERKIFYHGQRADGIVKSMLQHSRRSTGLKEPTDINLLAEEYSRLSYHGMRAKEKTFNAVVETYFDKSIGKIEMVPQDIGRVLLNLFNNAFYAVQEKKKQSNGTFEPVVSVRTWKEGGHVVVAVSDNGTGMPQKVAEKVFQPFFTTKPTGEGTGLGLSLSYDIIKAHGGELRVETKEAEYTEFVILLPVTESTGGI